jgi:hypothetical protein
LGDDMLPGQLLTCGESPLSIPLWLMSLI